MAELPIPGDEFIRRLLDEVPAAIFCKDADNDYRFVFWNRYAEKLWNIPKEGIIGKTDFEVFLESQAKFFRSKDEETMRGGVTVLIPEEELHLPGEKFWLRTRKVPLVLENPRRNFLLGISEDITSERQLKIDLQSQRATVASMQNMAALGELAGGVAHEVNSPLSALLIQLEIFRDQVTSDPPSAKDTLSFLGSMHRIASKIIEVSKTLYTYAAYSKRTYPELVPAMKILEDVATLNREKLRLADIELKIQPTEEKMEIRVRPMEILQAMIHLLNNAIEAMPEEGKRWILLEAKRKESKVELIITDSGKGIAPHLKTNLMHPYTGTKSKNSQGLGLSVVKSIAEAHGGNLELSSHSSNTQFVLRLPLADR